MSAYEASMNVREASPGAIIFFLSSEWKRYHRPGLIRAMARALKGTAPVIVVNNPVCYTTARWHRPERWRAWRTHKRGTSRLQPLSDNLWMLDSAIPLHDRLASMLPGAGWLNRVFLSRQLRAALSELKVADDAPLVSWFQFPTFHHYVGMLGEALPLYECYDEHSDVPGLSDRARARLVALETRMLARCALVLTTSKPLFDTRSARHPNVALTYNAADLAFFAPVASGSLQYVEQRAKAAPVVGYLGTIHEHTDLALLAEVVARRPDWRFVLIGPVQNGVDAQSLARLQAAQNVDLHGWVEEHELLPLLASIDVGVIPYRSDARFNRFVNPNKLHEFTAMGKPVVLTPGTDITSHGDSVSVAEGVENFIAAIEREHAQNSIERVQMRLVRAQANSWDARAALILENIARSLRERASQSVPQGSAL